MSRTPLNDIADVSGNVFLGVKMGCASCHDHLHMFAIRKPIGVPPGCARCHDHMYDLSSSRTTIPR